MLMTITKTISKMVIVASVFAATLMIVDHFNGIHSIKRMFPSSFDFLEHKVNNGYTRLVREDGTIDIFLTDSIGPAALYKDLIRELRDLKSTDTIILHMSNFGGQLFPAVKIINAMRISEGKVVVELEGPSYSAAALISCAADELVVHPHTFLMFHTFSVGLSGKASELIPSLIATEKMLKSVLVEECVRTKILTKRQVDEIMLGYDKHIMHKELIESDIGVKLQ